MNLTFVPAILKQNTQIHLSACFTSLSWADLQRFSQTQFIITMHSCDAVVLYSTATHAVPLFFIYSVSHQCSRTYTASMATSWLEETCSLDHRHHAHPCGKGCRNTAAREARQQKDTHCNAEEIAEKCLVGAGSRNHYFIQLVLRQNTWSKLNFSHEKIWFHRRQFLGKRNCAVVAFQLDMMCFILSFAPFLTSLRLYYVLGVTFQMAVCSWNEV